MSRFSTGASSRRLTPRAILGQLLLTLGILALATGCPDSDEPPTAPPGPPTVPPRSEITVGEREVVFQMMLGGTLPTACQVEVRNGGTGTLSNLTATVSISGGIQWLMANVGTTAPTVVVLTLTPAAASLPPGEHVATVVLGSTGADNSPQTITARFLVSGPPPAPTEVEARITGFPSIALRWTDPSSSETGFEVWYCRGEGCTDFTRLAGVLANQTSYTDYERLGGTNGTHRYRIRAINQAGYSDSDIADATIDPATPHFRIINNMSSRVELHDVVVLTQEYYEGFPLDFLPTGSCRSQPGRVIAPGQSAAFVPLSSSNLDLVIMIGIWERDERCATPGFTARTYFIDHMFDLSRAQRQYVSVFLRVPNTSGVIAFTISGSYLKGSLTVVGRRNGVVVVSKHFQVS